VPSALIPNLAALDHPIDGIQRLHELLPFVLGVELTGHSKDNFIVPAKLPLWDAMLPREAWQAIRGTQRTPYRVS